VGDIDEGDDDDECDDDKANVDSARFKLNEFSLLSTLKLREKALSLGLVMSRFLSLVNG